jgi:hypothetical protein
MVCLALALPSGNLVNNIAQSPNSPVCDRIRIYPYGLGADNDTFDLRLWGWYRGKNPDTFFPVTLLQCSCTISAFTGVAGGQVLDTERFADTISLTALIGEATVTANTTRTGTVELYTPANNTPAYVEVPLRGVELIEWDFDQTLNTPTMNALYQLIRIQY